ncbi:MAG: HypC/HybG/HupF family hydrogenase formation chaperone [Armatimonadetes bacterium]|nr:HypC/HybG/HupF family hydrogenase formation chaperone [Armatimonadota bacterium]NIM24303.1 HypC/HybG/HupF family hydrogenase formation chaperone [Armatimonadota bacterium]NIM68172.1 HypC/HybG/HupF family hydrogenase formation chaperone [Armatimonadota bacterium]NIM76632.1 HypC/HybG/HupF family hydrogenase formation chaperone [Armatimonadota bacterium]NIN06377.1 HypC/HybG/HupF family hydrogenase formation chaperone [Armatimonadota bacterium]
MCLGIPGEIIEIWEEGGLRNGKARFGGIVREVCLSYVPEAQVGDYVIVHAGFAISTIDEEEAKATLAAAGDLVDEIPG